MTRILALDVGTSSLRAKVYDERARPLEDVEGRTRYTTTRGHSGRLSEFDPDELADAARDAVAEARIEAGGRVDAVACSCFWHSLMAVDGKGRPLTPLLTWRDLRSAPHAELLSKRVDSDRVHRRTGCPVHPSFWPAKLAWLHATQPDVFRSAARFLSFPDYLYGHGRTTVSMASGTGLLDVGGLRWDDELLDVLGLEPDLLPELSDEPVDLGGPWFPALGDGACSNVGVGCLTPDRAALMVGTSGAFRIVAADERREPRPGLFLYRLDGRRFVEGGSLSDGGNLHDWLERTLRLESTQGLADEPPDGHGLTFIALLGGERSPGWSTRARGAVAGLTFSTEPRHILQAALEGVAFRFVEIAELMPEVHEVVATGGALSQNPDWTQIIADVLGRPIQASGVEEASTRGAAVVALERLGETPEPAPLGPVFEPREDRAGAYEAARARQRALHEALRKR